MKELSREEQLDGIERVLKDLPSPFYVPTAAKKILDAIEPPEVKPEMWGKFWDEEEESRFAYGELTRVEPAQAYKCLCNDYAFFEHFKPIPGLKEAIEKLEAGG